MGRLCSDRITKKTDSKVWFSGHTSRQSSGIVSLRMLPEGILVVQCGVLGQEEKVSKYTATTNYRLCPPSNKTSALTQDSIYLQINGDKLSPSE